MAKDALKRRDESAEVPAVFCLGLQKDASIRRNNDRGDERRMTASSNRKTRVYAKRRCTQYEKL